MSGSSGLAAEVQHAPCYIALQSEKLMLPDNGRTRSLTDREPVESLGLVSLGVVKHSVTPLPV